MATGEARARMQSGPTARVKAGTECARRSGGGSARMRVLRLRAASVAGACLIAAGALASAAPASAEGWQDAGQIAAICKAEPEANPVAVTFCLGYLQGTLDAFLLGRANCMSPGVDANGLRRILLEHVERHPDRLATSGPLLVYDAFAEAWPACAHMPRYSARSTGR